MKPSTRVPIIALIAGLALAGLPAVPAPAADPSHVSANGWDFWIDNTPTDGLAVRNGLYRGRQVFRRITVPQIQVLYSTNPTMRDQLGRGVYANVPYVRGSLKVGIDSERIDVRARYQEHGWPQAHSYRYDIRYLFYTNGQFRTRVYAYGPGLEPRQTYKVDIRIDLDLDDRVDEFFLRFLDDQWMSPRAECTCWDQGTHDGRAEWAIFDGSDRRGFDVWPRADDTLPALWALRFRDGEGNTDLGSSVVNPAQFKTGENIQGENIVLWYRSSARYTRPKACPPRCYTPVIIGPVFHPVEI